MFTGAHRRSVTSGDVRGEVTPNRLQPEYGDEAFWEVGRGGLGALSASILEDLVVTTDSDLMNVFVAAEFLGVHVQTLRRLARQKQIPAFKVGRSWRFRREALIRWSDEHGEETAHGETGHGDPNDRSVVVIDDDEAVCRAVAGMLKQAGCRTRAATGGRRGLELIAEEVPDLVLLDLKMPNMNGPVFLEKLRRTRPGLPVVIVTGYPDSDLMAEAMQYAPVMLLSKPIEPRLLQRTVRTVLGQRARAVSG